MKFLITLIIVFTFVRCVTSNESVQTENNTNKVKYQDSVDYPVRMADSLLNLVNDLDLSDVINEAMEILKAGESDLKHLDSLMLSIDDFTKIRDSIMTIHNVNNDSLFKDYLIQTTEVTDFKFDKINPKYFSEKKLTPSKEESD
ncbi:MAG: hypothetical protein ACI8Q1_000168 [Parvicella sp.]|jgi:hypothetical protein